MQRLRWTTGTSPSVARPAVLAMLRIALVAAALLLAGCTADESPYDPDPGDTDTGGPNVSETTPFGGPVTTPPSTGPPGFAPQTHHASGTHPELEGIVVEGDLAPCDAGHCVDVTARNDGDRTYFVQSLCRGPWTESMLQDGQTVHHREPMVHCAAFQLQPFGPSQRLTFDAAWNGTLWQEGGGYTEAPQGSYTWVVTFEAWTDDEDGEPHLVRVEFPVVVGPT